jgi:hypothetical protein
MGKHIKGEKYMVDDDLHQVCTDWNTEEKLPWLNFISENLKIYVVY